MSDSQFFVALVCVGFAAAYLAWSAWRTWRPAEGSGCEGGCGCAAKEKPKPAPARVTLGMERLEGRNPAG